MHSARIISVLNLYKEHCEDYKVAERKARVNAEHIACTPEIFETNGSTYKPSDEGRKSPSSGRKVLEVELSEKDVPKTLTVLFLNFSTKLVFSRTSRPRRHVRPGGALYLLLLDGVQIISFMTNASSETGVEDVWNGRILRPAQ